MNEPCVRCAGTAAPGHVVCQRCIDELAAAPRPALPWRLSLKLVAAIAFVVVLVSAPFWIGLVFLVRLAGRLA